MPFVLGERSRARLEGVHAHLVAVVERAAELSEVDFTVQEGLRSLETQQEYVRRKVSKTLKSKHLVQADGFGHAVDLVPWIAGQPRWEWGPIYDIAAAVRLAAIERGLAMTWGAVWDRRIADLPDGPDELKAAVKAYCDRHPGPDFLDGPHFELAA